MSFSHSYRRITQRTLPVHKSGSAAPLHQQLLRRPWRTENTLIHSDTNRDLSAYCFVFSLIVRSSLENMVSHVVFFSNNKPEIITFLMFSNENLYNYETILHPNCGYLYGSILIVSDNEFWIGGILSIFVQNICLDCVSVWKWYCMLFRFNTRVLHKLAWQWNERTRALYFACRSYASYWKHELYNVHHRQQHLFIQEIDLKW